MIISSKEYILNHDFGYGSKKERIRLKKLTLRNFNDVKFYVDWSLDEFFCVEYKNGILAFNTCAVKVDITED